MEPEPAAGEAFVFVRVSVPEPEPPPPPTRPTLTYRLRRWFGQHLYGAAALLRVAYFTRFPLIFGALPFIMVFGIAWKWMPAIARNGFLVESYLQLLNLTWISLMYAAAVTLTFRVTRRNAAWRFRDYRSAREQLRRLFGLPDWRPSERLGGWPWLLWLAMGLVLPGYSLSLTVRTPNEWIGTPPPAAIDANQGAAGPQQVEGVAVAAAPWTGPSPIAAGMAIAVGTMLAVLMLFAAAALQQTLIDPTAVAPNLFPFERFELFEWLHQRRIKVLYPVGTAFGYAFRALGPGYTVRQTRESGRRVAVAPGHAQLALFGVIALLAYYLAGFTTGAGEGVPDSSSPLPPLGYLLLAAMVAMFLFSSLSFWLDYYRVPVLILAVLVSAFLAQFRRPDHYYSLTPASAPVQQAIAECDVRTVFERPGWSPNGVPRFAERDGKRTLVVVTASGGGIQASAWIAQVLMGLDARYQDFTRSVGVVSAVSGGSVGAMYCLLHRQDREGPVALDAELYSPGARDQVFEDATASSLEPVAWGFAYRDMLRTLLPFVFDHIADPIEDRGWAIERVWERRLDRVQKGFGALTVGQLAQRVNAGGFPLPIFNATLVETGQRFLISPVKPTHLGQALRAREFTDLYRGADMRVTTATRLSATFSYISPICRAAPLPADADAEAAAEWESAAYHVADGGYVDNEGLVAAVDWVKELLSHYAEDDAKAPPFDRIVFIRAFPFPLPDKPIPADSAGGWGYAFAGPIATVLNGRTASQNDRGALELALLKRFSKSEIARVQAGEAAAPAAAGAAAALVGESESKSDPKDLAELFPGALARPIEVEQVSFVFRPSPKDALVPLNWKLTRAERERVKQRWRELEQSAVAPAGAADAAGENPLRALDKYFRRRPPPAR